MHSATSLLNPAVPMNGMTGPLTATRGNQPEAAAP